MSEAIRKNFKGQMDDEQVLNFFRKHWIQILPFFLFFPFLIAALGTLWYFLPALMALGFIAHLAAVIGVMLLTLLVHHQFMAVFRYYLSTVITTNLRVVIMDKSLFIRDTRVGIDMNKIQDVEKRQNGIWPNLLQFGTLNITMSGGEPVHIEKVPQPDFQFKKISEVRQRFIEEHVNTPLPSTSWSDSRHAKMDGGMDGT